MTVYKSKTGIITIFHVYLWSDRVGRGYLIYYNGRTLEPVISTDNGQELPENMYNLVPTEQRIVVVNERKQ